MQITAYGDRYEVYAEADPLVKGSTAEVLAHFTRLEDFKPLTEGAAKVILTVGGSAAEDTLGVPTRPGIYKMHLTPNAEGEGTMMFVADGDTLTAAVRVYADPGQAQEAAEAAKAKSALGVVFPKEISWKSDFATEPCQRLCGVPSARPTTPLK